ncbi:MAG: alpha-hydroxy-acid oxidizing protein [Bradyrhizobiaceae bacterium]|nr:alpha-hydroxy-acid oxidizing protein [Bradyrhizobiaceae bacterium]
MDSVDFDALEASAQALLSPGAYAFAATGAVDEITCAENAAAWQRLRLRPRVLRDITRIDTGGRVLGTSVATPIIIAPMGRHRLFHAEGEQATARGATAAGSIYALATTSTVSIEAVAAVRGAAPQWFQLYMPPDRAVTKGLIDRVGAAGFSAIVLTVDQPVPGSSPRATRHPVEPNPDIRHVNLPGEPVARTAYDPTFKGVVTYPTTYDDLEWLVRHTPLDVVVKGVLRGDDAQRCIDAGAKAIVVSNHGGRHLDTTVTTAHALPEIIAAVGSTAEVYVDGGIRRGTDILKALALGARAVLIGRPILWGLAIDGAEGVRAVLDHLRSELVRSMALCGAASLDALTSDLVAEPR